MGVTANTLTSSRGMELVIDLESGCGSRRRDAMALGVSSLQDAQRLLDTLWRADNGCGSAGGGRNRPAGSSSSSSSSGSPLSHSVTIPDPDAVGSIASVDVEEGERAGSRSPPTPENGRADGSCSGGSDKKQRRQKSPNSKRPPKPPRAPSLDAADLKVVKEMSELAMLKRARMERLRAIRKMKAASAAGMSSSSSSGSASASSLLAFVFTLFFCILIAWQGFHTRNGTSTSGFEGSPVSSLGASSEGGLISVQYLKNSTFEAYASSSASPNVVEQASGWDKL